MTILVTGSKGFVGRNLCSVLRTMERVRVLEFDCDNAPEELEGLLGEAEVIFHLAGVNRPKNEEEFKTGNAGLTEEICSILQRLERTPKIILPHPFRLNLTILMAAANLRLSGLFRTFRKKPVHDVSFTASRIFLANGAGQTTTR